MLSNVVGGRSIPGLVLAHQGGWDEILLVAGPMALVVVLLWLAKRRVDRQAATADDAQDGTRSMAAPTSRNRPTKSS